MVCTLLVLVVPGKLLENSGGVVGLDVLKTELLRFRGFDLQTKFIVSCLLHGVKLNQRMVTGCVSDVLFGL